LTATLEKAEAHKEPAFVAATPTGCNAETNYFDTSSAEAVIGDCLGEYNFVRLDDVSGRAFGK
jgi:hypothetical protein